MTIAEKACPGNEDFTVEVMNCIFYKGNGAMPVNWNS